MNSQEKKLYDIGNFTISSVEIIDKQIEKKENEKTPIKLIGKSKKNKLNISFLDKKR